MLSKYFISSIIRNFYIEKNKGQIIIIKIITFNKKIGIIKMKIKMSIINKIRIMITNGKIKMISKWTVTKKMSQNKVKDYTRIMVKRKL